MADPSSTDPFLEVQTDVRTLLTETRSLFSSFLRIRTTASPSSPELLQARTDLESNIATLEADINELKEAIEAVESDPYRFGLDGPEVQRRRGWVRDVSAEVTAMRSETGGSAGTHVAGDSDDRRGRLPPPTAFSDEDDDRNEDSYTAFEHQTQQTMMAEQDEQLDDVGRTVGALRGQAVDMGRELEEQHGMLGEVDVLADRVGGKLQVGVKKVGEVIRRNEDSVSSCCIGVLGVVLVLLLILVIVL